MNFALVKKHPLATGAVVIVGGIIVYMIVRNLGGGSSANSADGSVVDTSGYSSDPRIAAIQAGAGVQAGQQASALQAMQLQADVVNNQTTAALEAAKLQAERDQNIAEITTGGDVAKAQISSNTTEFVAGTQAHAYESAIAASTVQAQINADAAVSINDSRNNIVLAEINNQSKIIDAAGKDKGRSSTGWAQIESSFMGQGPQAIAANQPSAVASSPGAILSGIASVGKSIFTGLFA